MSYDDVPVMWGISDDDINISLERVIEGRMHEREGFQVKISKSKDLYPLGMEVHPSTRLARNFYKWENHVFSYCFIMVMSF